MKLRDKVGSLMLGACLAAGAVVACSGSEVSSQQPANGEDVADTVRLSLQPVSGITVDTVHYLVAKLGSSTPVLEGDLPTPGAAKVFNVGLPIPVGSGYELSLSGVAAESPNMFCTGVIGPFDVRPNQNTNLTTQFFCTDVTNGALKNEIMQTVDGCPRLSVDFSIATPNSAHVGEAIALNSFAHDLDGKSLGYLWGVADANAGVFAPAIAANTIFTCQKVAANLDLTLTVSNGECAKSIVTNVVCTND